MLRWASAEASDDDDNKGNMDGKKIEKKQREKSIQKVVTTCDKLFCYFSSENWHCEIEFDSTYIQTLLLVQHCVDCNANHSGEAANNTPAKPHQTKKTAAKQPTTQRRRQEIQAASPPEIKKENKGHQNLIRFFDVWNSTKTQNRSRKQKINKKKCYWCNTLWIAMPHSQK